MAKNSNKIVPPSRKKLARSERERRYNTIIVSITAGIVILAAVMIIAAFVMNIAEDNQVVAIVGDDEITVKEFIPRVEYQRYLLVNQFNQYFNFVASMADYPELQASYINQMATMEFQLEPYTLGREVINTMVDELIIRQEAEKLGITVSEAEIEEELQLAFGYYANPTEAPTEFPTAMPTSTLSELQLSLVTLTPTSTSMPTPTMDLTATQAALDAEVEEEAEPTPTMIDLGPTPTATEYTIDLFEADVNNYLNNVGIYITYSETDLRNMFENQLYREKVLAEVTKDSPQTEAQVWARHILVNDLETAEIVLGLLDDGGDFAAIAAQYSNDQGNKATGGDLGWFNFGTMVEAFSTSAFNLGIGQISEPVQTEFGYHIIQVLGHEDRPLDPSQYDVKKLEEFDAWLESKRVSAAPEILDTWIDHVSTSLSIPADWRDQLLALLATPTPEGFVEPPAATPEPQE